LRLCKRVRNDVVVELRMGVDEERGPTTAGSWRSSSGRFRTVSRCNTADVSCFFPFSLFFISSTVMVGIDLLQVFETGDGIWTILRRQSLCIPSEKGIFKQNRTRSL